jgi:predicted  nucleic acid-binding Zn ribbon protein
MSTIAVAGIDLYRRYLSPLKGFRCAHHALHGAGSCSTFGRDVFATIPEEGALDPKYDHRFAAEARQQLAAAGFGPPRIVPRGEYIFDEDLCGREQHSHFILFTTFLQNTSSLRCVYYFGSIPFYRLPYLADAKTDRCDPEALTHWENDYKTCDTLNMHSGMGEAFGTRQMQRLDSELSKNGIDICQALSVATGIPTYYYLNRYLNNPRSKKIERERRCPSCKGEWLLPEPHHIFDFKCDPCRLLSVMSPNV